MLTKKFGKKNREFDHLVDLGVDGGYHAKIYLKGLESSSMNCGEFR
jgi:hypothetical protein